MRPIIVIGAPEIKETEDKKMTVALEIVSDSESDDLNQKPPETSKALIMCYQTCGRPTMHDFVIRKMVSWGVRVLHRKLVYECRQCKGRRVYGCEQ